MIRSNVFIFLWNFSLHTDINNQNDGMQIYIWFHRKTTTTFLPQNICEKQKKIKKITYPRKGTCVCKHLFITCPAVFFKNGIYTVHIASLIFLRKCQSVSWYPQMTLFLQTCVPGIIILWHFNSQWLQLTYTSPISSPHIRDWNPLIGWFPYLCF